MKSLHTCGEGNIKLAYKFNPVHPDSLVLVRVSDPNLYPDPHGSHLFELLDPDPDPHSNCGSGSRRAKMTHKNRKKSRIFMFLST